MFNFNAPEKQDLTDAQKRAWGEGRIHWVKETVNSQVGTDLNSCITVLATQNPTCAIRQRGEDNIELKTGFTCEGATHKCF